MDEFEKLNVKVVGISKDTVNSHKKFIEKQNLNLELLSDPEKILHQEFDILKEKKLFGKTVMGTIRSTFVFDEEGNLIKEFRNVKSKGHAKDVLEYLQEIDG